MRPFILKIFLSVLISLFMEFQVTLKKNPYSKQSRILHTILDK